MFIGIGLNLHSRRVTAGAAPTDPTTPNFGLWSALTIASEVGATEYPMVLSALFPPEALTTDYVRLQVRSLPALTEVLNVRVLVGSGSQTFPGLSSITTGSHVLRERLERGIYYGDWSNSVEHGPDVIVPVLTSPIASSTGSTTASIGVTTDTAEGTLYYVLTTAATPPSKAQVKAGQNNGGTAAAWAGSQAVTTTGAKTAAPSSLTAATTYYAYFMHEDVAGNQSTVAAASSITTDAAAAFGISETGAPSTQNIGFGSTTATFAAQSFGVADSSRLMLVLLNANDGGSADASGITVGGIAATRITSASLGNGIAAWIAAVPTGTSGDVVVTMPGNINYIGMKLWRIVGANATPTQVATLAHGFNNSPFNVAVTTPSGGGTIIFAAIESLSGTASWSNATGSSETDNLAETIVSASRTTAGAVTVGLSGFGNQNSGMIALGFAP